MYFAKPSREEKDRVAIYIKAVIESRNGRFLKKVENSRDSRIVTWLPVDDSIVLLKINAALQYALCQKESRDGGEMNYQSEELLESSSEPAELNPQLGPDVVPISLSVKIQELMASMKQQLAPCQKQLGGTDKIQALVEKSMRNLQGAVSKDFLRDSLQPLFGEMSWMKELSTAVAKSGASARSEADIDQALSCVLVDRKPAALETVGEVRVSKNKSTTEFPAESSDAQSFAPGGDFPESSLRATADLTSDEELRQLLLSQVSRLRTDELLNLATLARSPSVAPLWLNGNRAPGQRTSTINPGFHSCESLIGETSAQSSRIAADAAPGCLIESCAALETRERKRSVDDLSDESHMCADNDNNAKRRKGRA